MATQKKDLLGTEVQKFLNLKAKITKQQKAVDELKRQADEMAKDIITKLEEQKTTRVDVKVGSVTLKSEPVFSGKDWNKVEAYAIKNKDLSIFQRRLSQTALRDYLEEGIKIPGIQKMTKKSLSIGRKRSG